MSFGELTEGEFDGMFTLGYNGKMMDSQTNYYNYGFRDYSPSTGRFTTVDPIKDSSNWYVLCGNDPVNKVDLLGLCEESGQRQVTTIDMLNMAENVYSGSGNATLTNGWSRVTNDELKALGLGDLSFEDAGSGFYSQLYKTDKGEYTYAFRGSEEDDIEDWVTNAQQGIGKETDQYEIAIDNTKRIKRAIEKAGGSLQLTGHSLGGGLASAAATVHGLKAMTFNAAGVSGATLKRHGAKRSDAEGLVTSFQVRGEILSTMQQDLTNPIGGAFGAIVGIAAPNALGDKVTIKIPGKNNSPLHENKWLARTITLKSMFGLSVEKEQAQMAANFQESIDRHMLPAVREALEAYYK